jgi:hypothetical protein
MADAALQRSGQCLCGAVRFRARLEAVNFGVCHCPSCRRWTGSALLGITVPTDAVDWQGTDAIGVYRSSSFAERAFCTRCGSALSFRITDATTPYFGKIELPIGLFDDANGLTMTNEIYIDHKPDSYAFADAANRRQMTRADCVAKFPLLASA